MNTSQYLHQERRDGADDPVGQSMQAAIRYGQVMEEASHANCSKGNQKALLHDGLNRMRGNLKNIKETDWMYEDKGIGLGFIDDGNGYKRDKDAPQPLGRGNLEERHFSLGRRH